MDYQDEKYVTNFNEEGEDQDSYCLEELPLKVEINENDFLHMTESDDLDSIFQCNIKAEPLEENYVDQENDLLLEEAATNGDVLLEGDTPVPSNKALEENLAALQSKRKVKRHFKCEDCSATFKYQSTYDYHIKSKCGSRMIADKNQLVVKTKDEAFTCNHCQKKMCSRTSLMVHMRIHNGERPFSCEICSRSFTQKAHLKDHVKTHLNLSSPNQMGFPCSECGEVFIEKKLLQNHMKVHFGDKIYDCEVCYKRFRTRSNLSTHKIVHSNKKNFPCTVCGKWFLRRPSLQEHMRTHTKEKPYSCDICGKAFAEKTRRNTHVKRHTGELKVVCHVCGKKFAASYDLRVHQRMHTGEKPFSCNICGRMFNRKAIMETHMTIHTGRKDYVCVYCGEAFNRKSKLQLHITEHTGEKFYCEICNREFKCKAYLIPHLRTHFGEGRKKKKIKRSQCLYCDQKFNSGKILQDHLEEQHPSLFCSDETQLEQLEKDVVS